MNQSRIRQLRFLAISILLLMVYFVWSTDKITLQGERTIYTVNCGNGTWDGNRCTGELVAGPRYRYRALKARGEVLFWVLGANEPSSKLTGCTILDGRNWTCAVSPDASKSVTLALKAGDPQTNAAWPTRILHGVSKMTWIFLDLGWKFTKVSN
jgi:hypothetical protein